MTLDDLLSEGLALERPCFLLSETQSDRLAGYWGGEREDIPNAVPPEAFRLASRTHIATFDPALFAELGLSNSSDPISLFETKGTDGQDYLGVEQRSFPKFSDISCSGRRLFAAPASSFPPFEAVCLYGGQSVANWLNSLGLERHEYAQASGQEIATKYEAEFVRRALFYSGGADVILGGWHMMWQDDDFFLPREMRLMATTIRDAEPFLEIWLSALGNISVKSRIT
jgi:hypothetical protein